MNMDFIKVNKEKCVGCGACVKACPIPDASIVQKAIDGDVFVDVKSDRCIGCGKCIDVCKRGARTAVDDMQELMENLKKGKKFALVVSPEFKFSFNGNWKGVLDWFKKQGISYIYDGSYGAEIHAWASAKVIKNSDMTMAISSNCAAVNNMIMQDPSRIAKLLPVYGPDACMILYVKKYLSSTVDIVVLSPCLAEKREVSEVGAKYFITCKSLLNYLKEKNIVINPEATQTASYNFTEKQGWFGGLMAMTGGFARNLDYMQPESPSVVISESGDNIYEMLDSYFRLPDFKKQGVLDINMCGGCTNSSCAARTISDFEAKRFYRGLSLESADMREVTGGRFGKGKYKDDLYDYFENNLKSTDFRRKMSINKTAWAIPKNSDLDTIYKSMGLRDEEHNIDCGMCGYATCEQMAMAIFNKQNICENCTMYSKRMNVQSSEVTSSNIEFEDITNCTFKLYADIEEIKTSVREIKTKSGLCKDMSVALDKLLTTMLATCQSSSFDETDLQNICEVLDKLKEVVAALTKAMTAASTNALIVDEAVVNITDETQRLSNMLATAVGISMEEMGNRIEQVRTTLNIVDTTGSGENNN